MGLRALWYDYEKNNTWAHNVTLVSDIALFCVAFHTDVREYPLPTLWDLEFYKLRMMKAIYWTFFSIKYCNWGCGDSGGRREWSGDICSEGVGSTQGVLYVSRVEFCRRIFSPDIDLKRPVERACLAVPHTADQMTTHLHSYQTEAGMTATGSMHSFFVRWRGRGGSCGLQRGGRRHRFAGNLLAHTISHGKVHWSGSLGVPQHLVLNGR